MTRKLHTDYGDYKVTVTATRYQNNNNYAVVLEEDGLPFAVLTVNLTNSHLEVPYAYVDVNNCPWAEKFIEDNNLGEDTGAVKQSGYCVYPLYRFNKDIIPEED